MPKKEEETTKPKKTVAKKKDAEVKPKEKATVAKASKSAKAEPKAKAEKKAEVASDQTTKEVSAKKVAPDVKVAKEVQAVAKYITSSPFKLRQVANLVRGKKVEQALVMLQFMPKEAARTLFKVVSSATANAERNEHLSRSSLYIHRLEVDEGPTLKRFRPRAQGRYGPILKRGSHIKVVLKEAEGR